MKYKIGQVIFFNWDNPFMKLIRKYNKITYRQEGYSHCGIITKVKAKTIQIHEAIGSGFVKSWYPKDWVDVKLIKKIGKIKTPKKRLQNVEKFADKYLGKGYGWLDVVAIFISSLTGFKLSLTGSNKIICSEAVARILYDSSNKKINFEKEYDKPYDLITPMDILLSNQLK